MNPLTEIPANVRRWLYLAYSLAGIALGAVTAYFGAVGDVAPEWVAGVAAVLAVVGTGLGLTAASNVRTPEPSQPRPDDPRRTP